MGPIITRIIRESRTRTPVLLPRRKVPQVARIMIRAKCNFWISCAVISPLSVILHEWTVGVLLRQQAYQGNSTINVGWLSHQVMMALTLNTGAL